DIQSLGPFAKRVQSYNGGMLPTNPSNTFDRFALVIVNSINLETEGETGDSDDGEVEITTENTPFIGVASQNKGKSFIAYYGIENYSKWIFTPLFRGTGRNPATAAHSPFGTGNSNGVGAGGVIPPR